MVFVATETKILVNLIKSKFKIFCSLFGQKLVRIKNKNYA
ncbi:hypothetical protein FEM08_25350 [Flavobacterium gilvum]|nr:hypothetical protein FEM08_25350 [Flavobacterium gilvum]